MDTSSASDKVREYEVSPLANPPALAEPEKELVLAAVYRTIKHEVEACASLCRGVLGRWREKGGVGHPKDEAFTQCELIALRLCEFVPTDSDQFDSDKSDKARATARDQLRSRLERTNIMTVIEIAKGDDKGIACKVENGWKLVLQNKSTSPEPITLDDLMDQGWEVTMTDDRLTAEEKIRLNHREFRQRRRERLNRERDAEEKVGVMRAEKIKRIFDDINRRIREGGAELTIEESEQMERTIAEPFHADVDGIKCSVTRYTKTAVADLVERALRSVLKRHTPTESTLHSKKYKASSRMQNLRRGATALQVIRHLQMHHEMKDAIERGRVKLKLQKDIDALSTQLASATAIVGREQWFAKLDNLKAPDVNVMTKILEIAATRADGKEGPPTMADKKRAIAAAIASGDLTPDVVLRKLAMIASRADALKSELLAHVEPRATLPNGPEELVQNDPASSDEQDLAGLDGDCSLFPSVEE
jgi:hypothetical protein